MLAFAACKKVELVPETQNVLLPLAVGNQWVYVDTFITTTSLPSSDTTVSTIVYDVTRARQLDHLVEGGGKRMERLSGWEIKNNYRPSRGISIVAIGDSLYSSAFYEYLWRTYSAANCNYLGGAVREDPKGIVMASELVVFKPFMAFPVKAGDTLAYFPAFHDLSECSDIGPKNYQNVNYQLLFYPLVATDSIEAITTQAGTFNCINFGSQWWAEGVGMVQSYHEGEASFYDNQLHLQTGRVTWKRSLWSYRLN